LKNRKKNPKKLLQCGKKCDILCKDRIVIKLESGFARIHSPLYAIKYLFYQRSLQPWQIRKTARSPTS
jgi:hypothetical protein